MTFQSCAPYTPMEFEDLALAMLRDTYVKGDMDIEQFERCVGEVLRGEFAVPMGGLPAPAAVLPTERR